jgi:tRNA pseudouridine55 synthase
MRSQGDERLPTSHDIVQLVRRWSRQRRIGHTGTLDPMASGLLILCMGQSTRLVEYYQGHDKQYYAEVQLGVATDTYDALGKATARAQVPSFTETEIEHVLDRFRGEIMQRPPAYSALKQGGESLHRKARRGETLQIDARPITVHSLDLVDWIKPDRLCLRVLSSAGTYIRSLAHDIGQVLGTGAHLCQLRRERVGQFDVEQALSLAVIRVCAEAGKLSDVLLPPGYGLGLPQIALTNDQVKALGHGQQTVIANRPAEAESESGRKVDCTSEMRCEEAGWRSDQLAQGKDHDDQFVGIMCCVGPAQPPETGYVWKAKKWFAANQ